MKYTFFITLLLITMSCNNKIPQKIGPTTNIDFRDIRTKEIENFVPSIFSDSTVAYFKLNADGENRIKSVSKVIMKDSIIYLMDFKQNSLLLFNKSGNLIENLTMEALDLRKIHDFQITDKSLTILDAKTDVLKVFDVESELNLIEAIKPNYEISSFYRLADGNFLAYTSPWNPKEYDRIQLTDPELKIKRSYFKRLIKEDENYVLSSNYIYPFRDELYYSHPSFNKLVSFDKSGSIKMVFNFEFDQEIKPKYLGNLEKHKSDLDRIKFVNGYCFFTDTMIFGDISNGLNTATAFYYSKSDNIMYVEKNKYSSILSNKVGSTDDGIIAAIYPGQYEIIKDSPSIPAKIKEHLRSGQYVISVINLINL